MVDIKVSAELMGYTMEEQMTILKHVDRESAAPSKRMQETVDKITKIIDESPIQEVFEGYGGFPIEKEAINKSKRKSPDDRNIGRVISPGGQSMVITGRKSDGRYIVVGKKGEKTAKYAEDIGVQESIDIEDLHQSMLEAMTVTNADKKGNTPAWQNYKKGMKNKQGKPVYKAADHVKEDTINEISADLALKASKKADVERGKAAAAGDKEKAKSKAGQASRLYAAQKKKRLGEETIDDLIERFIDLDDDYIDEISFEDLEAMCIEALEELDEVSLNEALEAIDGIELLTEAPSKHSAMPNIAVQAPQKKPERDAGSLARKKLLSKSSDSGPSRSDKVKSALKSAGSAVKKGLGKAGQAAGNVAKKVPYKAGQAAGHAKNVADKVGSAAKKVGSALSKAGSDAKAGYASTRKKPGVSDSARPDKKPGVSDSAKPKSSAGGGSSSGSGGRGQIKQSFSKSNSSSSETSSSSSSTTSSSSSSSSSGSKPAGAPAGGSKPAGSGIGGKLKRGIKKVVGKVARGVSSGADRVANRMGESYDWRKEMGI